MAKSLLISLLSLFVLLANAQHDDKFYFPSKELKALPDSLYAEYIYYQIDDDTLSVLAIDPKETAVANVLYFHGAGGNVSNYINYILPLLRANYKVYMIDFRGYGKSSGTPTHLNIATDAQIIFNNLLEKELDSLPLIVYGASMGAQVATEIVVNNSEYIEALVLDGAFTSFTEIAAESAPKIMRGMIRKHVTSPYSVIESLRRINNIPLLLIHSEDDSAIRYHHARKIFEAANEPKFHWNYKGDHLQAPVLHEEEFLFQIQNLLELNSIE